MHMCIRMRVLVVSGFYLIVIFDHDESVCTVASYLFYLVHT